ncbi:MAG: serine hydrolase domain-containing protein, partial [Actinomycetes bacterium]
VVDYSGVIATMRDEIPKVLATTGTVGATVALVDGDRVVWTEGFGFADKATGKPVTADTLFHIGSLSKTFTAVAVMQLVKRGKVKLDAPLARYVPEFRLLPRYRNNAITVRTVLDHHSGVPGDVFNGLFTNYRTNPGYRAWLVKALANMYPERPVNTVWAYNNSGFVLLQNLVEHVSGMSFRKYTRTRLFAPMAMPDSSFDDSLASNAALTRNYAVSVSADGTVGSAVAKAREYINGWAAGSITSNANQMANYLRMLLSDGQGQAGRVLPTGILQRMWKPQISTPLDILYFKMGLGFALGHPDLNWAGRVVQHDGSTSWNNSMMQLLPDSGLGVYASVNTSPAAGNAAPMISAKTLGLAYTAKTGIPRPADAALPTSPLVPNPSTTAAYAGKYATQHGLDRVEASAGGKLLWTRGLGTDTTSSSVISLAQDGWFTAEKPGWPQARFRTIQGRTLMAIRIPWGPQVTQVMGGERVPAKTLGRGWRARLGEYRAVDANPRTTEPFKA